MPPITSLHRTEVGCPLDYPHTLTLAVWAWVVEVRPWGSEAGTLINLSPTQVLVTLLNLRPHIDPYHPTLHYHIHFQTIRSIHKGPEYFGGHLN